jgi:hypothetical protein
MNFLKKNESIDIENYDLIDFNTNMNNHPTQTLEVPLHGLEKALSEEI